MIVRDDKIVISLDLKGKRHIFAIDDDLWLEKIGEVDFSKWKDLAEIIKETAK